MMSQRIKAVFHDGTFVSQQPCDFPEGAEFDLVALLDSLIDGMLLWQVAYEFLWASRKLTPFGYAQTQAQVR